jgi:hypothetical protein
MNDLLRARMAQASASGKRQAGKDQDLNLPHIITFAAESVLQTSPNRHEKQRREAVGK